MQAGNADRSGKFENNRYKETGNLISICMPPCMGKTIAAVFLCLSAVSVKGFLAWLLLSALLLQLPEPVSDALLFGQYSMCRSVIPLARSAGLCEGCISLSSAEGLLPTEKAVWHFRQRVSLVSARKGKNKGKTIRQEHKTGETP